MEKVIESHGILTSHECTNPEGPKAVPVNSVCSCFLCTWVKILTINTFTLSHLGVMIDLPVIVLTDVLLWILCTGQSLISSPASFSMVAMETHQMSATTPFQEAEVQATLFQVDQMMATELTTFFIAVPREA